MEPVTQVVVTAAALTVPTSYPLEETFTLVGVGMRVLDTAGCVDSVWVSCREPYSEIR